MRFIFIFFIFFNIIFAENPNNMSLIELYKKNYYTYICMNRWKFIKMYLRKNEKILSLVAYACLKKNYITPALDLSKEMRFTKIGRNNGLYINELFMMKLLIIRYITDNYDLSTISLPEIKDNLLAKIFYLIKKQKPKVKNNILKLLENNNSYIVTYNKDTNEIIIKIFLNNNLVKKVRYW